MSKREGRIHALRLAWRAYRWCRRNQKRRRRTVTQEGIDRLRERGATQELLDAAAGGLEK